MKTLILGRDLPSTIGHLLSCLIITLAFTYLVVITTSRSTYVRSHAWVFIDALLAAAINTIGYEVWLRWSISMWITILTASFIVHTILLAIDGDNKSIVDLQREKMFYRNDGFNLIRNAAGVGHFTLIMLAKGYNGS